MSHMMKMPVEVTDQTPFAWAGQNGPPPQLREVTEAEVVTDSLFLTFSPLATDFRQFQITPTEPIVSMTMLLYHDKTGVGIVSDYWRKRLRWFRFGCAHTYVETLRPAGSRSGLHEQTCTVCGHVNGYDTSD